MFEVIYIINLRTNIEEVISLFLKSLQYATITRENNPWLLYLLPFGGALVNLLYSSYGKDSSKGNNLIIERINNGKGEIPGRMAPLFVIGATLGNFLSSIVNLPLSFLAGLGMIGVFSGATKTPLASFIMGIELFGGVSARYLFVACIISYVFSGKSSIYTSQKNSLIDQ